MDWLDLLAVQGTLKSLLQHHSSKASVLQCSAFFTVQLSHPYMTTGKTIALTRRTFVGKVMSLLFNMLSRSVITFLPKSKHLLISWLQSPSAVIFLVIWLHFMVHLSEHLVLKKVYPAVLSLMTQTALWGPAPKIAVLGLGYSLGVSQSAQEMPGLRTIDFISYIGQLVLVVKNPPANAGDVRDAGSIPGLGRCPGV